MIVFSFAYLVYDFIAQIFFYQDFSSLGMQNIVHHIVTFVCYSVSLLGGRSMPMLTHVVMCCELSQLFMNMRGILGKKATGVIPLINNLGFVFSFTFCRAVLFPIIIYLHYKCTKYYDFWNEGKFRNDPDEAKRTHVTTQMH